MLPAWEIKMLEAEPEKLKQQTKAIERIGGTE